MSPLPGRVLALLSLMAWTAAAQPLPERTLRSRRVPLTGAAVDVRVAPGVPTTLNFDADIHPPSVVLEPSGSVQVLAMAARAITLMPVAELGKAVSLRVRFADACVTLEPRFSLRADAAEVDAQVTAYRTAPAPELLLAQVAELEARAAACEAEVGPLRERVRGTGPASWVISGQLDAAGVRTEGGNCEWDTGVHGMECDKAAHHLATTWMVVSMRLRLPRGQPAWKPGKAWLVSESSGERFAARGVTLASDTLGPDADATLAVEFFPPSPRLGEHYRVEVHEADGARNLSMWVAGAKTAASKKKDGP